MSATSADMMFLVKLPTMGGPFNSTTCLVHAHFVHPSAAVKRTSVSAKAARIATS